MEVQDANDESVPSSAFLLQSGMIGVIILMIGIMAFDPNRDSPDFMPSMVLGLIFLPMSAGIYLVPILILLRFVFRPLTGFLQRKLGPSAANMWIALVTVVSPIGILVPFIDGASWAHAVTASFAMTASCLLYARRNGFD